jgi:hypothetical protein
VVTTGRLPAEFGPTTNVVWKTELPFGHSSPSLTKDRIFLTAARGNRLVTICLDRKTGKIVWERDAPRPREEKLDNRNGPAGPTPATDGTNVYVFFADFGLISYDMDGKERWRVPLGPFNNLYGMGASPVLVGDVVVLVCDQNTDSFILAVGQRDGRVRWKTPRPEAHSGHSTPILYTPAGGKTQVVVPGSFLLTGYAADTGEKIWWVRGLCFELKSTPVVSGDTLYINGFGTPQNQPGSQPAIEPFADIVKRHGDATGTVTLANLPNGNARLMDRPRRQRRRVGGRMGLLPRGDGQRERHAGDSTGWPWRHDRGERALEVPQSRAAAAVPDRLPRRALHGERRRHRHRVESEHGRGDRAGPLEGRHRPLLRVTGRGRRQDLHAERNGQGGRAADGRKSGASNGKRSRRRHLCDAGDL